MRRSTCFGAVAALTLAAAVFGQGETAETAPPTTPDSPAAATPAPDPVPEAFASPSATLRTFLEAMGQTPPETDTGVACMDVSEITRDAAPELAIKLYKSINRIERVSWFDRSILTGVDLQRSATTSWTFFPRYKRRSFSNRQRFEEIGRLAPDAEITMATIDNGRWVFDAETVAGIEDLWDAIRKLEPIGTSGEEYKTVAERVEELWPETLIDNRFLRVKYWQWISIFLLILVGIVLDYTIRFVLRLVSRRQIARRGGTASGETLRRTVRPFGLAAAALFWLFSVRYLGLSEGALKVILPAVRLFAMLAGVWAAYRVTDLVGEVVASRAASTDNKFDDLLVPLVRKTVKVFITIFGLIYIANSLDVPIAPLIAGLGIGGAGFAFAAKDTVEHLFGSMTIIADRPFQVGDWVVIGDVEGTVEEVGFRSTRVRTFYNSLMTVPNGNLVRAVVDNFGLRKYRRWKTHLNLAYDTTPGQIEAFCEGVRELIRIHPYTRKDYYQVWLHQFGPHSLDVLVYLFHEAPDWQTELRERHRLMIDIIRLADQLGVEFAFPTQTLHLSRDGAHDQETAESDEASRGDDPMRLGRKAVHVLTADADWRTRRPPPYRFRSSTHLDPTDETQIESKVGGDA